MSDERPELTAKEAAKGLRIPRPRRKRIKLEESKIESSNSFIESYIDEAMDIIRLTGREPTDDDINKIHEIINKNLKNQTVEIDNNYLNDYQLLDLTKLADMVYDKEGIVTGYGAMYHSHEKSSNQPAEILRFLMDRRSTVKDEMFKHVNDEDRTQYNLLDLEQKVIKILANSWYGVSGNRSFIFYNRYVGPSITYTGYAIITSAMLSLEAWVGNNFFFNDFSEMVQFISRSTKREDYSVFNEVLPDSNITVDTVYEYLTDPEKTLFDIKAKGRDRILRDILKELSDDQLKALYYNQNLPALLDDSTVIRDVISECYDPGFYDTSNPPEKVLDNLNKLYDYIREICIDHYLYPDRDERANDIDRNSVLVVDTDSLFLRLGHFFDYIEKTFDLGDEEDIPASKRIPLLNILVHVVNTHLEDFMDYFGEKMNIEKQYRGYINFKNEYFLKRLILTPNKKNYASIVEAIEGNVLENPKTDIKGLAITKVSVNKRTRDYFYEVLDEMMLRKKDINPVEVYRAFEEYEEIIRKSLTEDRNTDFLTPSKFNSVSSYVNPYQMQPVRGVLLWNEMFPDNPIQNFSNVNLLKLTAKVVEDIQGMRDVDIDMYTTINRVIFRNPDLRKYGMSVISLPKEVETIPDIIVPYIDIEAIIKDNITPALPLLASLGFTTIRGTGGREQMSPFVVL